MTNEQALQIVDQVSSLAPINRQEQMTTVEAIRVLTKAVFELKALKEKKDTKDDKSQSG